MSKKFVELVLSLIIGVSIKHIFDLNFIIIIIIIIFIIIIVITSTRSPRRSFLVETEPRTWDYTV